MSEEYSLKSSLTTTEDFGSPVVEKYKFSKVDWVTCNIYSRASDFLDARKIFITCPYGHLKEKWFISKKPKSSLNSNPEISEPIKLNLKPKFIIRREAHKATI